MYASLEMLARNRLEAGQIPIHDFHLHRVLRRGRRGPNGTGHDEIALRATHRAGLAGLLQFILGGRVLGSCGTPIANAF